MDAFRFTHDPAWVTLGDGVELASSYLRASWQRWVIPVLGVAAVTGTMRWLMARAATDYANPYSLSSRPSPEELGQYLTAAFGGSILIAIIGLVLGWYVTAVAIHGLRGRPITMDWVVGAGLKAFAASLLLAGAWIGSFVAFGLVVAITGRVGLLLLLVLVPAAIVVVVRLLFWNLAIFDGAGMTEGASVSWMLTRGAVLRMLGWGLAVLAIMIGVAVVSLVLSLFLRPVPLVSDILSETISLTMTVFSTYLLAVLYESQRWIVAPPNRPASPAYMPPYGPSGQPYSPPASPDPFAPPPSPFGPPSAPFAPTPAPFAPRPTPAPFAPTPAGSSPLPTPATASGPVPSPSPAAGPQPPVPWSPVSTGPTWSPNASRGWQPSVAPEPRWPGSTPPAHAEPPARPPEAPR